MVVTRQPGTPGTCSHRYLPDFLAPEAAQQLFETLRDGVHWRSEQLRLFGRTVTAPRLVAWCGERGLNYRYAGVDHPCDGWWPDVQPLRDRVAEACGFAPALVLLNRYRDGRDAMGWHTDDEPGQGEWFASVSLGAPRRFRLRPTAEGPSVGLMLAPGSLLLMRSAIPHALPRTARPIGERINLTFREYVRGWGSGAAHG
jgi:alkylated DNA repair dioxygenase AlkB